MTTENVTSQPKPQRPIFKIGDYDLEAFARSYNGSLTIPVAVRGYWSRDPITIYVARVASIEGGELRISFSTTISHSSGGRDNDEVQRDYDACMNYAAGLMAAAAEASKIEVLCPELARIHLEWRAAEKAAEKAAIEADPAIGHEATDALLKKAVEAAADGKRHFIRAAYRGDRPGYPSGSLSFSVRIMGQRSRAMWRNQYGSALSAVEVAAQLSNLSARSVTTGVEGEA